MDDLHNSEAWEQYAQSIQRRLGDAFSGLAAATPLLTSIALIRDCGWGASFAVVWPASDAPAAYRLAAEVRRFPGKLRWAAAPDFNDRGIVISAFPAPNEPRFDRVGREFTQGQLQEEVAEFGRYIRHTIEVGGIRTTGVAMHIDAEKAFGPSAYDIYLVKDPERLGFDSETFELLPTSPEDRHLYVFLLDSDLAALRPVIDVSTGEIVQSIRDVFAKIFFGHLRVVILPGQLRALRAVLDGLAPVVSNPFASRAIDHLREIVAEASACDLSVILEPNR